jgi:predicted lactoylglutathione lyase
MVFSDTIHAMLLTHEKWATFTDRAIPDAHKTAQVLICVSEDSRDGVDAVVDRAAAAGGQADPNARQDYGFMYGRSYADPDGHIWEVMWMDPEAAAQGPEAFASQVGGG